MTYKYRGKVHDAPRALTLIPDAPKPRPLFDPTKCGTKAGFRQHQNRAVPMCDKCRAAQAAYMRDYNAARRAA